MYGIKNHENRFIWITIILIVPTMTKKIYKTLIVNLEQIMQQITTKYKTTHIENNINNDE